MPAVTLFGIWTPGRKKAILDSRVQSTRTLAEAIARMERRPSVFVSASAVGAYGSRGDEAITEQTPRGEGFLADVCRAWEEAAAPVADAGVRVVTPRFGIVVARRAAPSPRCCRRSRPGSAPDSATATSTGPGWRLDDLLAALEWALHDEELEGVVNVTAPEPIDERARSRRRSARAAPPGCAGGARPLVLSRDPGGMGEQMLLASQRAMPARLQERGFRFAFPALEGALRHELGRS